MNRFPIFFSAIIVMLLLAACRTAEPPGSEPKPIDSGTIPAGGATIVPVEIRSGVKLGSDVIYYEIDTGTSATLQVSNGFGVTLASSSSPEFFAPGSEAMPLSDAAYSPLAIGTALKCRGACVIEPVDGSGTTLRTVRITNLTDSPLNYSLYVYGEKFQDTGEPRNNSPETPSPLLSTESGAIEVLGDNDYFRVEQTGVYSFRAGGSPQLRLRAEVVGENVIMTDGSQTGLFEGDLIRVFSDSGYAGSPAASRYSFEIIRD